MVRASTLSAVAFALFAVAAARPLWHELSHQYTFEAYERDFHKRYSDAAERQQRRAAFADNLRTILTHNADPHATWRMGVNAFTDLTAAEFKATHLGYAGSHLARPAALLLAKPAATPRDAKDLPASVDWRDSGIVSPVKWQGNCGSCWAFASTAMVESYVAQATGLLFTLSPQQLVSCAPNPDDCGGTGGCYGSIPELAFDYVRDNGMTTEWQMPYTSFYGNESACKYQRNIGVVTVQDYVKLSPNSYTDVLNALATVGPLAINVQANVWQTYESGVFDGCRNLSNVDIDHVVQLVGYGTENGQDYWLVRNSWDVLWGEKGYIKLLRSATPECGTDPTPADGTGCSGGPPSVEVCGTCGILYDVSYPTGAKLL